MFRIIATFVIISCLGACANKPKNVLVDQITQVMEDRKRLWDTPKSDGGSRELDVSDLVCTIVSESNLDELRRSGDAGSFLQFDYFEASSYLPPKTKRYIFSKLIITRLSNQVLAIYMSPSEGCRATYRHRK